MAQQGSGTDAGGEQRGTETAMKRRGILRAAGMALGAVAAGITAKQASQTVLANSPLEGDSFQNDLAGVVGTNQVAGFGIYGYSNGGTAVYGGSDSDSGIGVQGEARTSTGFGVVGGRKGAATVFNGAGVYGKADGGHGLHGEAGPGWGLYATATGPNPAIYGNNSGTGDGVQGYGGGTFSGVAGWGGPGGGIGVIGFGANNDQTKSADGVQGHGTGTFSGVAGFGGQSNGDGVFGLGGGTTGAGVVGVAAGAPNPGAGLKAGVYGVGGASGSGVVGTGPNGVVGNTSSVGGYGGFFTTIANQSTAVGGQIFGSTSGSAAFVGAAAAGNYAAFFTGTVVVNGALVVSGGGKSAAVKHPRTGDYRALYCEESPESWFADYGKGKLVNGQAEVKLDADFAVLIHTEDYHVFLTPQADCNGLYVTNATASGFSVREVRGGTSSLSFSYRVVGKRSDLKLERLAKVTMPNLKLASEPVTVPAPRTIVPSPGGSGDPPQAQPPAPAAGPQSDTTNPVQPIPPPRSG